MPYTNATVLKASIKLLGKQTNLLSSHNINTNLIIVGTILNL